MSFGVRTQGLNLVAWADGQEVLRFVDSDGQGTAQPTRIANRYLSGPAVDQLLADEQYTLGTGPAVTATLASTVPGNTLWALSEHLGSVRDLVDRRHSFHLGSVATTRANGTQFGKLFSVVAG